MFAKFKNPQSVSSWSTVIPLILIASLLLSAGCGKKPPAGETSSTVPAATAGATGPTDAAAPDAASPDGGVDLRQLNHAYIGWIVQNRQRPKSYEEFAAKSGLQLPLPPAGKKFVIDQNGFIALVNH